MKVLFVSCYANNAHYIELSKKTLDKYLVNTTYDFICLNDAPTSEDENYLQICDIITGENNCYERILEESKKNNFIHIKIPQSIHIKNRPNHSSLRHTENLNWFNRNIHLIYPNYKSYDFICYIDSDAFFCKNIDLQKELENYDMAGPLIYIRNGYYIHTGLFFININTVKNMSEISWNNTMGTDTGSDIFNFIKRNRHYKIKKLGHYDGYSHNNYIKNGHTIVELEIPNSSDMIIDNNNFKLIDTWFHNSVLHLRAGSCFGIGSKQHRNKNEIFKNRLDMYYNKLHFFMKQFE